MTSARRSALLVLAATAVALSLVGLVALDYRATRGELVGLLREQAHALRESVAAAARSNRAASAFAAAQLGERLLDQARALADLDRQGGSRPAAVRRSARETRSSASPSSAPTAHARTWRAPAPDGEHGGRGPRAGWARGGGGREEGQAAAGAGARARAVARAAAAVSSPDPRGGQGRGGDGRPRLALGRRARRGRGEACAGRRHRGDRGRHGDRRAREAGVARVAAGGDHHREPRDRVHGLRARGRADRLRRRAGGCAGLPGRAVAHREGPAGARVRERRAPRRRRDGAPPPRHAPRQRAAGRAAHARPPRGLGGGGGRAGGARLRPRRAAPPLRRPQREARARGGGAAPSRPPRRHGRARLHRGPRGPQPAERGRHDGPAPEARVPGQRAGGRRRAGRARGAALG